MRTFEEFQAQVRETMEGAAAGKRYSQNGADGPNELYEFVQATVGGHGHALGEVIYKARRYAAKGNPDDLLKIAAWAFLIWRHSVQESGLFIKNEHGPRRKEYARFVRNAAHNAPGTRCGK